MPPKKYWEFRNDEIMKNKGLYIISTTKLQRQHRFKIGISSCSLKNRLGQLREVLEPILGEVIIYGLVVPKLSGGLPFDVRAAELAEMEHIIKNTETLEDLWIDFPTTENDSEWAHGNPEVVLDYIQDWIFARHVEHRSSYHLKLRLVRYI